MAAVLPSSTVHNTVHYPNMGHGDHRSPANTVRQSSSSTPLRMPASPKPQPTKIAPSHSSTTTLITPATSSQHLDSRNVFASQRTFSTDGAPHSSASHSDSNLPTYSAPAKSVPLVSPALSSSPLHRSPWSAEDIKKYGGATIHVRDLAHIQSFANEQFLTDRNHHHRNASRDEPIKYEISAMPIGDIVEMVAGLLTKITTTNDLQHERMPNVEQGTNLSGPSSSVFAFHGKNVPSITIMSYLSRIHKYCPTTYEVFLSLLVYFDRMTERVNARSGIPREFHVSTEETLRPEGDTDMPSADNSATVSHSQSSNPVDDETSLRGDHFFIVDSYNIHRLVIAGVTCASKFFSDVFYTNSRYAKVGGLPQGELNHLELQFLLLNDFRLNIPVQELEAYGTMLVEFYAREIIAQRRTNNDARDNKALGDTTDSD